MIFCFFQDRVFVSCRDEECRQTLRSCLPACYVLSRVMEEDVFSSHGTAPAASASKGGKRKKVDAAERFTVDCGKVTSVLTQGQLAFLRDVRSRRDALVAKASAECGPCKGEAASSLPRLNLRDYCKVPWRNISVGRCNGGERERAWVELIDPMVKSYVSAWKEGKVATKKAGSSDCI